MMEQSKIPVGSKITTQREYPACVVSGREIYGHLPAGATGEVVNHTADGRAMILFDGQIHTFEDLGSLTVELPHTDPQTMIEELQWDLATQRDAWLEIVEEKNAAIRDARTDAEAWARIAEQAKAQVEDLTGKLATANKELHDLRIKAGLLQPEPDWSQAPAWAQWWAVDGSGKAFWYETEPKCSNKWPGWFAPDALEDETHLTPGWAESLRQRPK